MVSSQSNGWELIFTGVAQLVEHRSPKPGVGSSSLSSRANLERICLRESQIIVKNLMTNLSIKYHGQLVQNFLVAQ